VTTLPATILSSGNNDLRKSLAFVIRLHQIPNAFCFFVNHLCSQLINALLFFDWLQLFSNTNTLRFTLLLNYRRALLSLLI
jgi:hypothetical protein